MQKALAFIAACEAYRIIQPEMIASFGPLGSFGAIMLASFVWGWFGRTPKKEPT